MKTVDQIITALQNLVSSGACDGSTPVAVVNHADSSVYKDIAFGPNVRAVKPASGSYHVTDQSGTDKVVELI